MAVSLAWAVAATGLAYLLFMRRDFTDLAYDGAGRRAAVRAVLPLAALLAGTVGVLAAATPASGAGIDRAKLEASLATAFAHLYRMQTRELHRPDVTEAATRQPRLLRQGRVPRRRFGTGKRLALRRDLAPARCQRPPARPSTSST